MEAQTANTSNAPQECLACKPVQNKTISVNERNECAVCGKKVARVKFDLSFTPRAEGYLKHCEQVKTKPTVKEFAQIIGTDEESVRAWANKRKKDENGNITDKLARPNFHAVIDKIDKIQFVEQIKEEVKKEELNAKQELFCKLYASYEEFFGNGVQSYIEAYGIDTNRPGAYNGARASASQLLTNPNILKRIDELLEVNGLNDQAVDKELAFVIMQKADLSSKVAAIREYNKLKTRIIDRIDHTTKGKEIPAPLYGGKATKTL